MTMPSGRSRLTVHILHHPQSVEAPALARRLFDRLNGPSADFGPRIPVRFGAHTADGRPEMPRLDGGKTLVVVLVDGRMARRARPQDEEVADAWTDLIDGLLRVYPPQSATDCAVLPVAIDGAALSLSERLDERTFVRLDARQDPRHLELHVAIRCLRLLDDKPAMEKADTDVLPPARVGTFVSHAKRNLSGSPAEGPVAALLAAHHDLPLTAWYDSAEIPPGATFAAEIDEAIEKSTVVVVILTDHYSSREWCRREVLAAKTKGRPMVVVDAITSRVVRLFPYIGNAPTVRWRAALAETTEDDAGRVPDKVRAGWEADDAKIVMLEALYEALRHRHQIGRFGSLDDATVLGTHPESITVAAVSPEVDQVFYPDPPLSREELKHLQQSRPGLLLTTPLGQLAAQTAPAAGSLIALSLSAAEDAERYGGSEVHLATVAHDLALYLLFGGYRLLYGGSLEHGAVRKDGNAPGDDMNYVRRLMDLVERHTPMSEEVDRPIQPIVNHVPWPWHLRMSEEDRNFYRRDRAKLVEGRPPEDPRVSQGELDLAAAGGYRKTDPLGHYLSSLGLTRMRMDTTDAASARVALGGKLTGYSGVLPGVAEEVLLTLEKGRPVYLLGAFGGATRAVVDVLRGGDRPEFTQDWCADHVRGWAGLFDEYRKREHPVVSPEEAAGELRRRGADGLAPALNNGLTEDQNDELTTTTDPWRAVELILTGLRAGNHHEPR